MADSRVDAATLKGPAFACNVLHQMQALNTCPQSSFHTHDGFESVIREIFLSFQQCSVRIMKINPIKHLKIILGSFWGNFDFF